MSRRSSNAVNEAFRKLNSSYSNRKYKRLRDAKTHASKERKPNSHRKK